MKKRAKQFLILVLAFAMTLSLSIATFTEPAHAASEDYKISRTSAVMVKGQKLDLFLYSKDLLNMDNLLTTAGSSDMAEVTSNVRSTSFARYKGLSWKSSKPKVVSVTKNGTLKAKKAGKSTISVKYNGKTYKCTVKVYKSLSAKQREKLAKKEAKRIVKKYTNSSMTKKQKAQVLAYYMIINVGSQHDQSTAKYRKNYGNEAYSALVMHLSACSGHCKAYKLLCETAGIKCKHVNANKWTHQWNEVYVGGKWYQVDTQGQMVEFEDDYELIRKSFDPSRIGSIYLKKIKMDFGFTVAKFYA